MDSLTQIVLGVAIAHVGLGNKVGWKKTVALGAIVGTLPDLDIYIGKLFQDPLAEIEIHRGFSHSVLFFIFFSFLIFFLSKRFFKEISHVKLYLTIFFILLTHSLLDVFTTWGTQLLWPYPVKFALKSVFVVDVFYTIPLLIAVIFGIIKKNKNITSLGLILSSTYLLWGLVAQNSIKNKVIVDFKEQYAENIQNVTVKPTFSNSILWNVMVETSMGYYLSDRSLFDRNKISFQFFPNNQQLLSNKNDKNIQRLIHVSENQYIITENEKGLIFNDLRFGLLKNDANKIQFAFSYQLMPSKEGFTVQEMPKDKKDGAKLLKNIWNRILNPL